MRNLILALCAAVIPATLTAQAPVTIGGEPLVLTAPAATAAGGVTVSALHANGTVAFSYTVTPDKPVLVTTWVDKLDGSTHTVSTDCERYLRPEACVRAHARYVTALKAVYPIQP